jgi:hypothetical protein
MTEVGIGQVEAVQVGVLQVGVRELRSVASVPEWLPNCARHAIVISRSSAS